MTENKSESVRLLLGQSKAIQDLNLLISRVAVTKTNILILGESGTGKEVVARLIHELSPFRKHPFVAINCGAIAENLIESELFGHQRGSFTGAVSDKMGLFQVAHQGTVFLDEVGELPLGMQVKLLRAIQDRSFRRVGGVESIRVDVRIIAATNRNLEEAVKRGLFREDLYYRLNVIIIKTPPLRNRKEDVALLARHFLGQRGRTIKDFDEDVIRDLEAYRWPGNVRELENTVERAIAMEQSQIVTRGSLPVPIRGCGGRGSGTGEIEIGTGGIVRPRRVSSGNTGTGPEMQWWGERVATSAMLEIVKQLEPGKFDLDWVIEQTERAYVKAALEHSRGNARGAARLLGMSLRNFQTRLVKLRMG